MITFVLPSGVNRADVLAFYEAFEENGQVCIGFQNHGDYDVWIQGMRNRKTGKNLPEGYVRENFYLCYDGEELVGVFSLKFELTEFLRNFGGHVGYAVKPSRRNRGFATQMLKQGLEIAKDFGFDRLLAVCDDDNYASEAVILKNGGLLEDVRFDEAESVFVKRYWIKA